MKKLLKHNMIVNVLLVVIILLLFLYTIDDYNIYTIKENDIKHHSEKIVEEHYNLNDKNNFKLLLEREDKEIYIYIYEIEDSYTVLAYSKSVIFNKFKLIDVRYDLEEGYSFPFIVNSPLNTKVYEIELESKKSEVHFISSEKNVKRYFRILEAIVIFYIVLIIRIYFLKKKK